MKFTKLFEEIDKRHLCEYGGKTVNLAVMKKMLHESIPDGFGVSGDAFLKYIENNPQVNEWTRKVKKAYETKNVDKIIAEYPEFEKEFIQMPLPREIENEIKETYRNLCRKEGIEDLSQCRVAVRSSAICEDCATSSLAGRFSSFIDIAGEDDVVRHVKKVWASAYEPRAIHHRDINDINIEGDKMGVTVQRFVRSRCAGVMLTSPTADGSISTIGAVQIVQGIGEDIVQGTKTGDYIEFDKVNEKEVYRMDSPTGEGCELTHDNFKTLVTIANLLEQHYGRPQDVEFVISPDNRVYVVQTRPVVPISQCPR